MRRQLLILAAVVALVSIDRWSTAALIRVDVNDRTVGDPTAAAASNTAPGFQPFVLNGGGSPTSNTVVVGAYTFQLNVFDDGGEDGGAAGNQPGAMDDRDRVVPTTAPTLNEIYDDFLFVGGSAGVTGGLDMRISGGNLQPSTAYRVSIYAYDGIDASFGSATQTRTANWVDGNNADAHVLTTQFTINQPPTTDNQYKFTGLAVTDASGMLFLKGRRVTAADLAVYVNGIEIVPEPAALAIIALGVAGLAIARCRRKEIQDGGA